MDAHAPRKPALGFVFVTLVLLVLGFGIIIPVLPGLVTQFKGGSVSEGSGAYGWLVGVYAGMQFVASPILGSLSDRFGRRKVILIALAGSAVDYVIMGLAPNMAWLFAARVISAPRPGRSRPAMLHRRRDAPGEAGPGAMASWAPPSGSAS